MQKKIPEMFTVPESLKNLLGDIGKRRCIRSKFLEERGLLKGVGEIGQTNDCAEYLFEWFLHLKESEAGKILFWVIPEPDYHHCLTLTDTIYITPFGFVVKRFGCGGSSLRECRTPRLLAGSATLVSLKAGCEAIISGRVWKGIEEKLIKIKELRYGEITIPKEIAKSNKK